jgi:hypothetical protein
VGYGEGAVVMSQVSLNLGGGSLGARRLWAELVWTEGLRRALSPADFSHLLVVVVLLLYSSPASLIGLLFVF